MSVEERARECVEKAEARLALFKADIDRLLAEGRILAKDLHEQLRPMFDVTAEQMNRRLR